MRNPQCAQLSATGASLITLDPVRHHCAVWSTGDECSGPLGSGLASADDVAVVSSLDSATEWRGGSELHAPISRTSGEKLRAINARRTEEDERGRASRVEYEGREVIMLPPEQRASGR